MSTWAYRCRPLQGEGEWWVARERVDELPPDLQLLQVHVDGDWRLARLDRRQAVAVDGQLLRDAAPVRTEDLPTEPLPRSAPMPDVALPLAAEPDAPPLQAAAISLAGQRMVVVLVPLAVVQSPGEADMLAADLKPRFGGVDVVLMGQDDDGTPHYHGNAALLALLADVPVDRMPWKAYRAG